jgi:hypothetical protein
MSRALVIALGGAFFGAAVGGVAAWHLAQPPAAPKGHAVGASQITSDPPEPSQPPPSPVIVGPVLARLDDDDKAGLRALVQQEVRAALASNPQPPAVASGQVAEPRFAPDASTPEILAQLSKDEQTKYAVAESIVQDGIARGQWAETDRRSFRRAIKDVPEPLHSRLLSELFGAANRGEIKRDQLGPLL